MPANQLHQPEEDQENLVTIWMPETWMSFSIQICQHFLCKRDMICAWLLVKKSLTQQNWWKCWRERLFSIVMTALNQVEECILHRALSKQSMSIGLSKREVLLRSGLLIGLPYSTTKWAVISIRFRLSEDISLRSGRLLVWCYRMSDSCGLLMKSMGELKSIGVELWTSAEIPIFHVSRDVAKSWAELRAMTCQPPTYCILACSAPIYSS